MEYLIAYHLAQKSPLLIQDTRHTESLFLHGKNKPEVFILLMQVYASPSPEKLFFLSHAANCTSHIQILSVVQTGQ